MKFPLYQIDAFTSTVFSGNPAAVCLLDDWLKDEILQAIAAENNLSETAFLVKNDAGYDLRWFTPATEVALCGHATLAAAFLLFKQGVSTLTEIRFRTRKSGDLIVSRKDDLLEMDFPARPVHSRPMPSGLPEALGIQPLEVHGSAEDILVVLEDEREVLSVQPDFTALEKIDCRGIIVTARGNNSDFVSRFFAPRVGVPEDPVTGSAHCVLIPYWAERLAKSELHAFQVSKRGGELFCALSGDRVKIAGHAVLYLEGTITV